MRKNQVKPYMLREWLGVKKAFSDNNEALVAALDDDGTLNDVLLGQDGNGPSDEAFQARAHTLFVACLDNANPDMLATLYTIARPTRGDFLHATLALVSDPVAAGRAAAELERGGAGGQTPGHSARLLLILRFLMRYGEVHPEAGISLHEWSGNRDDPWETPARLLLGATPAAARWLGIHEAPITSPLRGRMEEATNALDGAAKPEAPRRRRKP